MVMDVAAVFAAGRIEMTWRRKLNGDEADAEEVPQHRHDPRGEAQ